MIAQIEESNHTSAGNHNKDIYGTHRRESEEKYKQYKKRGISSQYTAKNFEHFLGGKDGRWEISIRTILE